MNARNFAVLVLLLLTEFYATSRYLPVWKQAHPGR